MGNQESIKQRCPICNGDIDSSYLNDWRYKYHCRKCGQYFELNAPTKKAADLIYDTYIGKSFN